MNGYMGISDIIGKIAQNKDIYKEINDMKRKYEGFLTEEMERFINITNNMSYDELNEYYETHKDILKEDKNSIAYTDLTIDEICERYDLIDATNFFSSHGVNLDDLNEDNNI